MKERKESTPRPTFWVISYVDGEEETPRQVSEKIIHIGPDIIVSCPNNRYCFINSFANKLPNLEADITTTIKGEPHQKNIKPAFPPGIAIQPEGKYPTNAEIYSIGKEGQKVHIATVIYDVCEPH